MHASSKCRSDQTLQYGVYTFEDKSNCTDSFSALPEFIDFISNVSAIDPSHDTRTLLRKLALSSTIYATANSVVNEVVQTTQLTLKQKILLRLLCCRKHTLCCLIVVLWRGRQQQKLFKKQVKFHYHIFGQLWNQFYLQNYRVLPIFCAHQLNIGTTNQSQLDPSTSILGPLLAAPIGTKS